MIEVFVVLGLVMITGLASMAALACLIMATRELVRLWRTKRDERKRADLRKRPPKPWE